MAVPTEALQGRLAGLPEWRPGRAGIEVRFAGAKDAVQRLYALAQALVNDYERFEELVAEEWSAETRGQMKALFACRSRSRVPWLRGTWSWS